MENIKNALNKLYKFSPKVLQLGNEIIDDRIEKLEMKLSIKLPNEFIYLLKKHNGIFLLGVEVFGLGLDFGEMSLDKIYDFEHENVQNSMPNYYFPFSPDGMGNHYCLDLSRIKNNETCPVVFWQWDIDYNFNEVETCNVNFQEWIEEVLIGWAEADYNYDGSEKR